MCPVVSQDTCEVSEGGVRGVRATLALLLSLSFSYPARVATCPPSCLCASDIISCSGRNLSAVPSDLPGYAKRLDLGHNALAMLRADWISEPFDRLATLVLSQNTIEQIEPDAFIFTPHLRHLDLSSNRLSVLNTSTFHGLGELELLLLFGNQISQINTGAFGGLSSLQRLYLSGNRLGVFPLELYEGPTGPRNLTFLDLSHNLVSEVPVKSLLSLHSKQQGGIYLQGNPLFCNCTLLAMLEYWTWRRYRPLVDFQGDYSCGRAEEEDMQNCPSSQKGQSKNLPVGGAYHIEPGDWLLVPCPGLVTPPQEELVVFWVTPRVVLPTSTTDPSGHLRVLPNGTLEIWQARPEDTGKYTCVAARGHPSDSLEVSILVGNSSLAGTGLGRGSNAEHFNTAFTTLASCVVSIILVLLYLYLTPCRCRKGRGGSTRRCGGRAILLCSDPREVDTGERRSGNGKRVAFLEPQAEASEKCVPKMPAGNSSHTTTEGILKNGSRTVGQTLTDPANVA